MHLEANQANQAVNVTVTVNGTGIVNVIDYSLLVQSALPGCGRSAQGAPFAQLPLRRAGGISHTHAAHKKHAQQHQQAAACRAAQDASALAGRFCVRLRRKTGALLQNTHEKCARWRGIFTVAAKIGHLPARRDRVIRYLFRV